ncbi:MAG: hypothetical protein GQ522_04050 [Deltaproteobacteria bacterium]|nr:hypothetical protein [Deltaproteobacteria bacterium]
MFLAMFVGLILGMVVLVIIVLIFSPASTPFELFPVGMIITMFTGMGVGMVQTQGEADFTVMLVAAVLFSLSAQFAIDIYNMRLRGEVPIDR